MYQLQSAAFRSPYPLSSVPTATFPGFAVRTPPIMPPHPASLSVMVVRQRKQIVVQIIHHH
ncbi:hypothetical protein BLA29_002782 [Euroglyphus maynei]|uniref:Uncharacterized protein n=1 Tax=Euroglyphus maynei TaxID=6958 RepID=A0A1Y3B587_EURMA|nr:hypothetical protein BLA29_002782 [Euroglyphus maynei]